VDVNNYAITDQATTTASITPLDVELPASANLTKVYDATTLVAPALSDNATGYGSLGVGTANNSAPYTSALTADSGISGGLTLVGRPVFSSADAGSVTVDQGSVQLTGTRAANYRLVWVADSATITPAPLTITANDDARFYSLADTAGYNGVRYSGFVGGQTSAVLGGTLAVARDRSVQLNADANSVDTQDAAGSYNSVLVPSGLTSNNYDITFVNGKYTIVPAGELLVKVANTSAVYGSAPVYTLTSAGYMDNANVVTDLLSLIPNTNTSYASVSGTLVTVTDGTNTVATFNLGADNPATSTSGTLKVGTYSVAPALVHDLNNSCRKRSRRSESSADVGSSQITRAGRTSSARATATRCCWPTLSADGRLCAASASSASRSSSSRPRARAASMPPS
jgi:hypothetical protein